MLAYCKYMAPDRSQAAKKLHDILANKQLTVLFQPIIDLQKIQIKGYEGLIRGPSNDLLHSPVMLSRLAKKSNHLLELENLSNQLTINSFVDQKLQGNLFLRLNAQVFMQHKFKEVQIVQAIEKSGIDPIKVVITLCTHENDDFDNPGFVQKIVSRYVDLGFKVCVEDAGESLSSLESLPHPYSLTLKINPHLIQDVDKDPLKVQLLSSLLGRATPSGLTMLAEGITSRSELLLAKELGITLAQGSFIARADKNPLRTIPREITQILTSEDKNITHKQNSIDSIMEKVPTFSLDRNNDDVFQMFEKNPQLILAAVTNHQTPVGLINRSVFINRFARPYQRELYGKKSCTTFMDPDPLIVDRNISIQELSRLLAENQRHVSLGFIFTEKGCYLGVGTSQSLIQEITDMQIRSARFANPLTGLPGNVAIEEHIDTLLENHEAFCVCYFDLDNFKPFNDVYGFSMGDAMIQMTAKVILKQADPQQDFVGHIGGDDFIVLFRSPDWESRCQAMLKEFASSVQSFFNASDLERGGYIIENRRGEKEFFQLSSLSVGAVPIKAKMFDSHRDIAVVATESKKMAKKIHGNSLYINQREYRVR